MKTRIAAPVVLVLLTTACATTTTPRSQFTDIPLPSGMEYQPNRSVMIESQTIRAGQLVYRGRLEPESLGDVMRARLESNGWRSVSRTSTAKDGTRLIYEKDRNALEVHIYEELWYTYLSISATEVLQPGAAETTATAAPTESASQTVRLDASVNGSATPEPGSTSTPRTGDSSFTDKVKHFFNNLFTW
jgi:hypothetical protein